MIKKDTVLSQSDLNECNSGRRSSDVLVATLEKCERLQKQLDIAVKALKQYADGNYYLFPTYRNGHERAEKALKEIEELSK